ncbi:free fatty acid receptor 2 [Gadus chalcogrammus]|uniref:free fatty acid receptor 2 n=1 Tax=Gadus chalcogrammus TaxID=1042646 RepID=UPI0024C27022|nr:free fatty acid receptor 2 [Gadus chalcogrammus]
MQDCHTGLCLSVYVITFVTGFPANVLAFYTFCGKVRKKATPIDILLLNLTVSDLLFLLFLPFKMQEVMNNMLWEMPYALCPLSGFIFYTTIYNSTFFLTAVSVERYLGVAFPIQHTLRRRPLYAVLASLFFWVFSIAQLSIVFIMPFIGNEGTSPGNGTHGGNPNDAGSGSGSGSGSWAVEMLQEDPSSRSGDPRRESVCYENFTPAQLAVLLPVRLELGLVLFCVPFLICSFCYINFIHILSRLKHIGRRRKLRAIGMALGTLLVFAVCFVPYNVSHLVGFVTWRSPDWRDKALLFSTFNACLDPLIFYLSSAALRSVVGGVVQGARRRLAGCWAGSASLRPWSRVKPPSPENGERREAMSAI